MLIERPPLLYRAFFPKAHWRFNTHEKVVYLTFDDGPVPEVTPWVLDMLDKYHIKASFFCVADNVRKHPEVYRQVIERGHTVGNHTFHHLQGWKVRTKTYLKDVEEADQLIHSKWFRPPHGHIRLPQFFLLRKQYHIIMWDVITRDYSCLQVVKQVFNNVKKYTRNGSIIVFHDSLKAEKKMKTVLPMAIEWLLEQGYTFKPICESPE
ncbi:MAG: Peptidoglycan-N-acetylglucosamine deacetylase [Candidatus Ordinivivax streblomastigis]|uniref:Peptidoglycan-N-acetylglucosamine deacetylase n=1 Tax=Candidatus Ordinivivax streblomastigis TaxID=2540710 RepID=A0A5M8P2I5_9BACT|nr:MAG: Peptidoglycan-N-acetylglucosamine deacetylase [Candidatus Ordinivivax streblomastigis]